MEALKIRNASAMPAPTWSWLRMNAATLEVPEGLERGCFWRPDGRGWEQWRFEQSSRDRSGAAPEVGD